MQDINEYDLWKPTEKCPSSICTRIFVVIVFRLFEFVLLFAIQLSVYTVTTLKSHTEKKDEYALVCEALLIKIDRQNVWKHFPKIFWVHLTWFLKVGLEKGTVTPSLSKDLNPKDSTKFWKVETFEKYALESLILGGFMTTVSNLAASELFKRSFSLLTFKLSSLLIFLLA